MLNVSIFLMTYLGGIFSALRMGTYCGFIAYQLIYFLSPQLRWWGSSLPSLPYSKILVIFLLFLFLVRPKDELNKLFDAPQFKWFYFILTLIAITSFYAVWQEIHVTSLIDFLKLTIIISVAYKVINTSFKLNCALWAYCIGSSYIGLLAYQVGRNSGGRVQGIGTVDAPDANGIAAAIAPSILLYGYLFLSSKNNKVKLAIIPLAVLVVNGLILINSRGAFLAVFAAALYFLYYLYFSKVRLKKQRLKVTLLLTIALAGAVSLVDESFINRIYSIKNTEINEEQESGATRVIFWQSAFKMSLDYPFGKGTLGFQAYAPVYIPEHVHTGSHRNRSVHSTWMEVLTEIGYLGLFCFIMLIMSCFKTNKQVRTAAIKEQHWEQFYRSVAISSALICFMVAMTFLNRYRAEIFYWLILFSACNYAIFKNSITKQSEHNS